MNGGVIVVYVVAAILIVLLCVMALFANIPFHHKKDQERGKEER